MKKFGVHLSSDSISLDICSDFSEGFYFKKENKIVLCANNLVNVGLNHYFEQAMKRQVIFCF